MRLKNGESFNGETKLEVIDLLERISPDISDQNILKIRKDRQRLQEYIEDAPRTIHETKERIEAINSKIRVSQLRITEGVTFEDRQKAKEEHTSLHQELSQQEHIHKILDNRLKGILKHGSAEAYQETIDRLNDEISVLQNKISKGEDRGFKKKHLGALVLLFFANDAVTSNMPTLAILLWGFFLIIAVREVGPRIFIKQNKAKLAALFRERDGFTANCY